MIQSKVIIFPTDTVYGIGTSIYDSKGMDKIYQIKKRDRSKPLAVLCANIEQIESIAYVTDEARKLINKFLPGPLTVILKSKECILETFKGETVGVRIPNYDVALEILKENGPMATTSVNESGMPSINNYNEIVKDYSNLVDEIYKPSSCATSSLASTVVLVTDNGINVVREGAITYEMIKKCLEEE